MHTSILFLSLIRFGIQCSHGEWKTWLFISLYMITTVSRFLIICLQECSAMSTLSVLFWKLTQSFTVAFVSDFLSVLNSAVLVRQELAPSINIYTHVQHILVVMVVHWNCTAQSYVVSYKSFSSTSTVKFWVCVLPGQKLFSTPPIPCCAVPSIRE